MEARSMETDGHPKNVLIIESGEGVGGSAFSMFRITKYLDKARYQPHVFVYFQTEAFRKIERLGVPVTRLRSYQGLLKVGRNKTGFLAKILRYLTVYGFLGIETAVNGFRLARFIRKTGVDIVHCNNGLFENFAAAFAARVTGTPCVAHVRGTESLMKIEKLCHGWVDYFIVLNRDVLNHYTDAFGTDKVRLVFNGVDLDEFEDLDPAGIRAEFSIPEQTLCVGTFARLVEGKGIPEFLQVAARINRPANEVLWFIAGGGEEDDGGFVDSLHELAQELGIADRVIFAGWRDDGKACMAAMDLVLQISTTFPEGMSLAPIEAMALSKPVVVSDNPGYDSTVIHGESGYITESGDIDTLTALVEQIIDDPNLARQLGAGARQRVLDEFEYRIIAARIQQIYEKLIR